MSNLPALLISSQHVQGLETQDDYRSINFDQLMDTPGPVEISGFIRSRSRPVQTTFATYGQGMVADCVYRFTVNIASFDENDRLEVGVGVRIRGEVDTKQGFFEVTDMNKIDIREVVLPMNRQRLAASSHPVIAAIPSRRQRIDNGGDEIPRGGDIHGENDLEDDQGV